MAVRIRALLILLFALPAFAQQVAERYIEQEERAFEHYAREEWPAAIAAFEKQIAIYPAGARPYYNIACCHARMNRAERAATWLELAILHGWRDARHLDDDQDFARIRESEAFRRVRAHLDRLPPLLPQRVDPATVPAASSVARILADGLIASAQLELEFDERLMEPMQFRARLFAHYDRQMARLARYIEENGDARDAHNAGRERVRLASMYWMRAEEGSKLESVAASYVKLTAEEFIERWPTSPHLYEVQLWRADLTGDAAALRRLVEDAPRGPVGARALAKVIGQDPSVRRNLFPRFMRLYGTSRVGRELIDLHLWRVRLEVEGLPDGLRFDPPVANPREGKLVIAVVRGGDEASIELVREHAGKRLVLILLDDEPWTGPDAPRATDADKALEILGAPRRTALLVFEDGKLVEANSRLSQDSR